MSGAASTGMSSGNANHHWLLCPFLLYQPIWCCVGVPVWLNLIFVFSDPLSHICINLCGSGPVSRLLRGVARTVAITLITSPNAQWELK